jgi:hypothetical protein
MFVRPRSEHDQVWQLARNGKSPTEIARITGIPRGTVRNWLSRPGRADSNDAWRPRRAGDPAPNPGELLPPQSHPAYAYLLGLYLGDGCLSRAPRGVYKLRITLDTRYPGIIATAAEAMSVVMPRNRVGILERSDEAAVEVTGYSRVWPVLLPQHGNGLKHLRPVKLRSWQLAITRQHPRCLVRGLIHSDGCRFVARQPKNGQIYPYARYAFANRSRDIIEILCDHLDLLGIDWTCPRPDAVQIARREAVAMMDSFIGPKR